MPHATSVDLLVLHTLRCIGFAGLPRVAEASGLPEADAESELIDLAVAGLVTYTRGEFGGWGLTDAGKISDAERISAELDAAGTRTTVARVYEDFLVLNPELLDLCTAWQSRPADHGFDTRALERFADFDQRAERACADLSAAMDRFQRYRVRLGGALGRAQAGELEYLTDDLASYHTIWFQLHEDLLATLGIPRH